MKKIHRKILNLCEQKARRVAKTLRYTNKSHAMLNVFDKKRMGFFPKRCFFNDRERQCRDAAQYLLQMTPTQIRNVVVQIFPYENGLKLGRKKHQAFQYKNLADIALRSSL